MSGDTGEVSFSLNGRPKVQVQGPRKRENIRYMTLQNLRVNVCGRLKHIEELQKNLYHLLEVKVVITAFIEARKKGESTWTPTDKHWNFVAEYNKNWAKIKELLQGCLVTASKSLHYSSTAISANATQVFCFSRRFARTIITAEVRITMIFVTKLILIARVSSKSLCCLGPTYPESEDVFFFDLVISFLTRECEFCFLLFLAFLLVRI